MDFGLNLFSIRDQVDTPEKFLATAHKLKAMGYSEIQCSACPYDVELYKKVTAQVGMPVVLTHVGYDRIINDTDALMKEHEAFGCQNIGLGSMDCSKSDDEIKKQVEDLNNAARKMKERGFKFFYHNHNFEFKKMADGRFIMDYLIEEGDAINFTLDTYWLAFAKADLTEYITKMSGRIGCVHLKDGKFVKDDYYEIAPVGSGWLDFADLVPKMINAGTKHFIVEQDNAPDKGDSLGQVNMSIDWLKKNLG